MIDMICTITIPGEPQGKGRPRISTVAGHARAYTPPKTVAYESLVQMCWCEKYGNVEPHEGAVRMTITAYLSMPKSASKAKRAAMLAGEILPTKKPDADNLAKIVADALNKLAYRDDTQIIDMHIHKRYSDRPRVEVAVEDINA